MASNDKNTYLTLKTIRKWYIFIPAIACGLLLTSLHSAFASDIASNYSVHSEEITDITGVKVSIDLAWTLLCGFLVFNMQAGFAFLGAGFLQKKNTVMLSRASARQRIRTRRFSV